MAVPEELDPEERLALMLDELRGRYPGLTDQQWSAVADQLRGRLSAARPLTESERAELRSEVWEEEALERVERANRRAPVVRLPPLW